MVFTKQLMVYENAVLLTSLGKGMEKSEPPFGGNVY